MGDTVFSGQRSTRGRQFHRYLALRYGDRLRGRPAYRHTSRVKSVAFSPDGRTLASGGSWDDTICLWDAITGAHKSTLTGHTARVNSVAFSPDGRSLASGAGWPDNSIRLWDAVTGEHKRTLTGHTESVRSVAFSPDGKTLASGSWDGTVLLWGIPLQ